MKLVGLCLLILVAAVFVGEGVLIAGYFALTVAAWRWTSQRWISVLVTSVCLVALLLHAFGFKLYGRPVLADRESLSQPRRVIALEPPAKVIFQDGGTIQLKDVFFPKRFDLREGTTNYHDVFQDALGLHAKLGHNPYQQEWLEVEVANQTGNTAKAVCLRRANYGCGNTWFPHFLPERLPRHVREDLAATLVGAGLALPTAEHAAKVTDYWDPLMNAFQQGYFVNLPLRHPEVIKLGRLLVDDWSYFEDGLQLLFEVEDVDSFPKLKSEIQKRRNQQPVTLEELGEYKGGVSPWWLVRMDSTEVARLMREAKQKERPEINSATQLASLLTHKGDWSGFDFLVQLLVKPNLEAEYRKSLGIHLVVRFDFLHKYFGLGMTEKAAALFPEWFAEYRGQLRWVKQPNGSAGFALVNGSAFDQAYYDTMKGYEAKISGQKSGP